VEKVILFLQLEAIQGPQIDREMLISLQLEETSLQASKDSKLQLRLTLLLEELVLIVTINQIETHLNLQWL